MRKPAIFLSLLMGLTLLIVNCDGPTEYEEWDYPDGQIVGRVGTKASNDPVANATVFLLKREVNSGSSLVDTVAVTDEEGYYSFSGEVQTQYYVYAIKLIDSVAYRISPYYTLDYLATDSSRIIQNIELYEYRTNGTVLGEITNEDDVEFGSIEVNLGRFEYGIYVVARTMTIYDQTHFEIHDIETGIYTISARAIKNYNIYTGISEQFFCDGRETIQLEDINLSLSGTIIRKPVIYIYPEVKTTFSVQLNFSNGTKLLESVPAYHDGWNVTVDPDGKIDEQYPYLYYDAYLPSIPDFDQGYCISTNTLATDLTTILSAYGLTSAEINDLVEYWQPYLTGYPYYLVYAITDQSVDEYVSLEVTPKPASQLRIWLFFKGAPQATSLSQPTITRFVRTRTTVVEWGGAII